MGLFNKKNKVRSEVSPAPAAAAPAATTSAHQHQPAAAPPPSGPPEASQRISSAGPAPGSGYGGRNKQPKPRVNASLEQGSDISRTTVHVGGLPLNVFGWDELTPLPHRATLAPTPALTVIIHLHGRTGSAAKSEGLVRQLYHGIRKAKSHSEATTNTNAGPQNDFLVLSFDQRNHGHRKTLDLGQKAWKEGNKSHAVDL